MTDRLVSSENRRTRPDWWARLFAVGGLAAGAAALYYSWVHTANLPTTQEIVSSYDADVSTFLDSAKATLDQLEGQEVAAFKTRNNTEFLAIQERDKMFAQRMAELSTSALAQNDAEQQAEDFADMVVAAGGIDPAAKLMEGDESETITAVVGAAGARLQIATRTLRPTGPADAEITTINNTTETDASVVAIEFVPDSLYEAPPDASSVPATLGVEDLDIQFLPTDNRARDPKKHGTYGHVFTDPMTVLAGSSVDVRVQIQNKEHVGWGLRGKLVLDYGDDRLEIPDVSARFVATP